MIWILLKNIAMKKLFMFLVLGGVLSTVNAQTLQVGDKVPNQQFDDVILPNSGDMLVKNISLENFANKIVVLDFWATWCGPCIASMPKYESLQKKFKDKLQVIGITHESVKRIQSFSKNRPVGFMLAIDTTSKWKSLFDYRTIPHVVLLDQKGIVRAITRSDEITEQVIGKLISNESIDLPLKKDNMEFDATADNFNAPSGTKESFNIQPAIENFNSSMSKVGQKEYEGRRISLLNFPIDGMYRVAYKVSYYRTAYEIDQKEFSFSKRSNLYCLDVIVPKAGDGLYTYMKKKLAENFDVKARMEKRKMMVTVLKRNKEPLGIKVSDTTNKYYSASSNFFSGDGVLVSSLAEFLEGHGLAGMPVVDETGISGRYNIHMEWEPEKKGSMIEQFRKMGFELLKEEREIEMVVLYR